jgi:hypothetical protein
LRWPGKQIVLWNFDEAAFHVSDFHQYGWADQSDPASCRKSHLKSGREGLRLNVSAFISREFGVLKTIDGGHVGTFERGATNNADSTAELFGFAAKVMAERWPEKLHIIVTDGPRIHTMLDPKACTNRGFDEIFGDRGLDWILRQTEAELASELSSHKGKATARGARAQQLCLLLTILLVRCDSEHTSATLQRAQIERGRFVA